jgi:uncharacterized protein YxjI
MTQAGDSAGQPEPSQFVAQMTRGDHQHMSSDISLTDTNGAELLLARRPSLMHRNFEIVNPQGQIVGNVNHESHLTRSTFNILDATGKTMIVLEMQSIHDRRTPPKCWLNDDAGRQCATIAFTAGILGFEMDKLDGTRVFSAEISVQGGILEKLQQFGMKRYGLTLFDQSFPKESLLGIIAAIDAGLT